MSQTLVTRGADAHVGALVTLEGTALVAHAGPIVMLADRVPVYVTGLDAWESGFVRKKVHVTGKVERRKLAPDPETNEQGEHSHGMFGTDLVVDDATWVLV